MSVPSPFLVNSFGSFLLITYQVFLLSSAEPQVLAGSPRSTSTSSVRGCVATGVEN